MRGVLRLHQDRCLHLPPTVLSDLTINHEDHSPWGSQESIARASRPLVPQSSLQPPPQLLVIPVPIACQWFLSLNPRIRLICSVVVSTAALSLESLLHSVLSINKALLELVIGFLVDWSFSFSLDLKEDVEELLDIVGLIQDLGEFCISIDKDLHNICLNFVSRFH